MWYCIYIRNTAEDIYLKKKPEHRVTEWKLNCIIGRELYYWNTEMVNNNRVDMYCDDVLVYSLSILK